MPRHNSEVSNLACEHSGIEFVHIDFCFLKSLSQNLQPHYMVYVTVRENNGNRLELVCIEKIHKLFGLEACINDNTLPRIAAPLEYIAVGLIFTQNKMVDFHKSFL